MTHGTTSSYRNGCRCDACRAAVARANRGQYERRREVDRLRGNVGPRTGDELEVECWCRARIVLVPVDEVRAGLTRPCSDRYCRATDERRRSAA